MQQKNSKCPRVSVVLPTFNRADLLARSVQSVLSQSFSDFELIVVDDASTDSTLDVLKRFDDQRIRMLSLAENVGGARARNIGIESAFGELIAFQDSDDEWLPQKLEILIGELDCHPDWRGIFSLAWKLGREEAFVEPSRSLLPKVADMHHKLMRGNLVDTPTALVRKECLIKIEGFDNSLPRFQDWDLFIRLTENDLVGCFPEPLILSYASDEGISSNPKAAIIGLRAILEKNREIIEGDRTLRSNWHYKFGDAYVRCGHHMQGLTWFAKAIALKPFSLTLYKKIWNSIA